MMKILWQLWSFCSTLRNSRASERGRNEDGKRETNRLSGETKSNKTGIPGGQENIVKGGTICHVIGSQRLRDSLTLLEKKMTPFFFAKCYYYYALKSGL